MMYISSPYSPPPFDKEKSQQTKNTQKKHTKKPGQWHSPCRVEPRPVYRTYQVMDSPHRSGWHHHHPGVSHRTTGRETR